MNWVAERLPAKVEITPDHFALLQAVTLGALAVSLFFAFAIQLCHYKGYHFEAMAFVAFTQLSGIPEGASGPANPPEDLLEEDGPKLQDFLDSTTRSVLQRRYVDHWRLAQWWHGKGDYAVVAACISAAICSFPVGLVWSFAKAVTN